MKEPRALRLNSAAPLAGVRVLIVEDDPDFLEVLYLTLRQAGADVRTAGSAEEALERLNAFAPNVLVSDIGMPRHDGCWLIREVRKLNRDLPAIAVTAFSHPADVERARSAGFDEHLAKPASLVALIALIGRLATGEKS